MSVLLLPSANVPAAAQWHDRVHRDDIGRNTRRGLRTVGKQLWFHGRPIADRRGPRIVQAEDNTVPVGRKFHIRRSSRHCRQSHGPRRQYNVTRRRLKHDGMSRHQVNAYFLYL